MLCKHFNLPQVEEEIICRNVDDINTLKCQTKNQLLLIARYIIKQ